MNTKAKGTAGERELIKFLNENDWCAIRAAGSGSSRYPSPDILAGNAIRRLAIECKVTAEKKKYFDQAELDQLQTFARKFGAEAWLAIKFPSQPWYFLMIEDLEKTGVSFGISLEDAQRKALTKEELLQIEK
jgi:Holliday junction resolvase